MVKVTHDIIPTQIGSKSYTSRSLLHMCVECARKDSVNHRLTCEMSDEIWSWTRMRVAMLLRTDPRYIPNQRLIVSEFSVTVSAEA